MSAEGRPNALRIPEDFHELKSRQLPPATAAPAAEALDSASESSHAPRRYPLFTLSDREARGNCAD